jgi:DNA-binding LacI/PurR family transcriptional regulator
MDVQTMELGHLGVELLIQKLDGQTSENRQVLVPCKLTVRGSSGVCRRIGAEK